MRNLILVLVALVLGISSVAGCNESSKQKTQPDAEQQQRVEADRQHAEAEQQRAAEEQEKRQIRPQADWVTHYMDEHDWSHFIDYSNGEKSYNEMEHVNADVSVPCSIHILERRTNNLGFFKKECTVNLTGFPSSSVSLEKVDQNNTVADGVRMSTRPYWSVKFEDANRIACTDTFAGATSTSDGITIEFNSQEEASQMEKSFKQIASESCSK